MEYVRILQFEEWRKKTSKNVLDVSDLEKQLAVQIEKVRNDDGFVKQRIIGGKPLEVSVVFF
jgi:hypothetical protein